MKNLNLEQDKVGEIIPLSIQLKEQALLAQNGLLFNEIVRKLRRAARNAEFGIVVPYLDENTCDRLTSEGFKLKTSKGFDDWFIVSFE